MNVKLVKQCNKIFFKVTDGRSLPLSFRSTRNGSSMKSFGVRWLIIFLDKSTVIKDGLIGSPLNETNLLFEFTVLIFRFYVFENLSKLCSAPWLFSGTKTNSFRVGVFWFRTSWWFPFYMFQLAPKRSLESASRQSWALETTKKRGIALADCERENWFD